MKLLVVGLGSMGKRRVRNLLANGISPNDIVGVDKRKDRAEEARTKYGITTHTVLRDEDVTAADAFVISTPPDHHLPYAQKAAAQGKHMFIEASVLAEGLEDLAQQVDNKHLVAFPSCTMRFFAGPRRVSELVRGNAIGKVLAWQYQSGQYLPDWHPWEPITDFYVSNPETGGCREIVPFEMVWLEPLFGAVVPFQRAFRASDAKMAHCGATEHVYDQLAQGTGFVARLQHIDIVDRSRHVGTLGVAPVDVSDSAKRIRVFSAATGQWTEESVGLGTVESKYINPEEPYIEEIRTYLSCIQSKTAPAYTLRDDIKILDLLYRAEESAKTGRRIAA